MSLHVQSVAAACLLGGVLLLVAVGLTAAPDPDLFDGRVAVALPKSSVPDSRQTGVSDEVVEQTASNGSAKGASHSRDWSQMDRVSAGQTVSVQHSKSGTPSDGGAVVNSPEAGAEASAVSAGVTVDSAAAMNGAGDATSGRAASVQRRFEEFSFGATSSESNGSVPINRSKNITVPASDASANTVPANSSPPVLQNDASGATPASKASSADYGSRVPSGL